MPGYDTTYTLQRILETAKTEAGAPESRIRSSAYLSFTEVDKYLRNMMRNGLVRYNANTRTYKTTKNGEEFLKTVKQMDDFLKFIEE